MTSLRSIFRGGKSHGNKPPTRDLTTGNPFRLILSYSLPLFFGNLFQQLYSMADTVIVGRLLGANALAAVGSTGPMNFLVLGFVSGITAGCAVITAQRFGAKDESGVRRSVAMNIMLNALFCIIITVISVATVNPVLSLVNTPQEIFADASGYITIIFSGIGTMILYNVAACLLRAVGDSKSPLYFLIIASILNIALDIVFIYFFGWGVAGAAWATVVSQGISGIVSVIYIAKRFPILCVKKNDFAFHVSFARQHLQIGIPMALQFSITAVGVVILQGALNVFGPVKIAAFTAVQKVEQLPVVFAMTLGVTMANYTGQNIGAHKLERIKEGTKQGVVIALGGAVIGIAIVLSFYEPLISLFLKNPEAELMAAAKQYLFLTCVFFPPLFVIFIFRNVLQSMGKSFMPLMTGVLELVARAVVAYTLPHYIGFLGVCLAEPAAWLSAAIMLAISYMVIIRKYKMPPEFA
ncbi:MAG: MATE family efflux transporter [Treponemataceae bacterium]|nr:MAG: MATE family efflux transporter [Treponemataceae bacterium]